MDPEGRGSRPSPIIKGVFRVSQAHSSGDPLAMSQLGLSGYPDLAVGGRSGPIRVYLFAKDAILRDGIATQFRASPSVTVLEATPDPAGVAVIITDELQDDAISAIASIHRSCTPRIVVVAAHMTPVAAAAALHAGACCFLKRPEARTDRLLASVRWAADAEVPLAEPPRGVPPLGAGAPWQSGLSARDVDVLRLVADGRSTASIAVDLAYSESTIKNVIHEIVIRLGARNRAHAVAMAIRAGVI